MPQAGLADDVAGDVLLGALARHLLQEQAGDQVVGVGVAAGRGAGLAGRGGVEAEPYQLLAGEDAEPVVVQALRRALQQRGERRADVVGDVARVVQQHPYGDPLAAFAGHHVRQVAGDRRVQLDGAAGDLLEHGPPR
ncbi:hypothetical protein GCM10020220_070760 [Nonomuraea rubra]